MSLWLSFDDIFQSFLLSFLSRLWSFLTIFQIRCKLFYFLFLAKSFYEIFRKWCDFCITFFFFELFFFSILILCFFNSSYHRRKCKYPTNQVEFLENNGRLVTDISILVKCSRLQIHWCFDILQSCTILKIVIKYSPYQCIHMHIKIKLMVSVFLLFGDTVADFISRNSPFSTKQFDYISIFCLFSYRFSVFVFFLIIFFLYNFSVDLLF